MSGILKVRHHGSRTASSPGFLQATSPEVAIYMVGEGNRFGHPHEETIATAKQTKVRELERQIDQIVYELHGLKPEEIAVVEEKQGQADSDGRA